MNISKTNLHCQKRETNVNVCPIYLLIYNQNAGLTIPLNYACRSDHTYDPQQQL